MACPRCLRWQRHVRLSQLSPRIADRRAFSAAQSHYQETANVSAQPLSSEEHRLSILDHKRRPVRAPNDRPRSSVHDIDLSQRVGTKYSRPVIGAMEWQTSTYHYNKQTSKAYPVLANTTNKLLEAFAVLEEASDAKGRAHKKAVADRRKEGDKVYVSPVTAKDYGSKIVLDVFVHDAKEAAKVALREKSAKFAAKNERKPRGQSTSGRRTGSSTTGARSPGLARRPGPSSYGARRAPGMTGRTSGSPSGGARQPSGTTFRKLAPSAGTAPRRQAATGSRSPTQS